MKRNHVSVDVCVVGDGLVGLSVAFHLLRANRSVAVVGSSKPGRASTAAAGMLTPTCEYDPWMTPEFLRLLKAGREYYPEFLAGSSLDRVTYHDTDFTLLDLHERSDSLESRMDYLPGLGFDCTWLAPWQVSEYEPNLTPTAFRGAIRVRGDAVVNPIELWSSLRDQIIDAGVALDDSGVVSFDDAAGGGVLVRTGRDEIVAERVVIAAGSWSMEVGELAGLQVPLCPVKGQIVQLTGDPGLITSVIFMPSGGCGSIVERSPGVYVVGTSEEYLDPACSNTAGVVGAILTRLTTVLPAAADWQIDSMWSGFRPMTGDELPIIGVADDERFVVATGHHRNGVLLAPLTGRLIAELLDGASHPGLDLSPFRFGREMRVQPRFADKY